MCLNSLPLVYLSEYIYLRKTGSSSALCSGGRTGQALAEAHHDNLQGSAFDQELICRRTPPNHPHTQITHLARLINQLKMPSNSHQPAEPGWLAKPSGACCLKGHLHAGSPQGSFEQLADMETYVSQPPEGKANGHVVLYYPDVFGFFTNGLLVMDTFAEAGYLTLGIEYFQGVSGRPNE